LNEIIHLTIDAAGWVAVAVTVILYIAGNKKAAKKDMDARHQENQAKLNEIIAEHSFLPPHDHIEEHGPLDADGIIRRPKNGR
jgi:hypothetical protein